MRPCMGGWCQRRDDCPNHRAPVLERDPEERICDTGRDGFVAGYPIRLHYPVGTWERRNARQLRQAQPFDGIAA